MSQKFKIAPSATIEEVEYLYREYGIAMVVTDGSHAQFEKEEK